MSAPAPAIYLADDATLASTLSVPSLAAGSTSATYERHIWNDKGGVAGSTTLRGGRLVLFGKSGSNWVQSGVPIVDGCWGRARISGIDSTGDATMPETETGFSSWGANNPLVLPDIPQNCAVYVEFKFKAPGSAGTVSSEFRIEIFHDEMSYPLADKIAIALGSGVIPGYRDESRRRIERGLGITASSVATVVFDRGWINYDGARKYVPRTTSAAISQNDSAAAALAAGEKYYITVSVTSAGAITMTKGAKGVTPAKAAKPSGELLVGWIAVLYQAGGTSVIAPADVDLTALRRGDYHVEPGVGLSVVIHSGDGMSSSDLANWSDTSTTVNVAASSTNYVWLLGDGTKQATVSATRPEAGATLLATATTDGSGVTAVDNSVKTLLHKALTVERLTLRKDGNITGAAVDVDATLAPFDAWIVNVETWIQKKGTVTAGSTICDLNTRPPGTDMSPSGGGTSIFASQATDDRRPTIPYTATTAQTEDFDVVFVAKNTVLSMDIDDVPTITSPGENLRMFIDLVRA